jgi:hypothetical protein
VRQPFKSFLNSFLFLFLCFLALALLLTYASVTDFLSPRQFALCFLLLMGGLFTALVYRYRRAQLSKDSQESSPALRPESPRVNNAIKRLRVAVIVLPILLLNGLWLTQGQPLLPRLVGAAINLLFTGYFIFLLRKAKKAVETEKNG